MDVRISTRPFVALFPSHNLPLIPNFAPLAAPGKPASLAADVRDRRYAAALKGGFVFR